MYYFDGSAALSLPKTQQPTSHLTVMSNESEFPRAPVTATSHEAPTDTGERSQPPADLRQDELVTATRNEKPQTPVKLDANNMVENPSTMPELLYNQLMRVHQQQMERDADLLDEDGRFAKMQARQRMVLLSELTEAFVPRIVNLEEMVASLRDRITRLEGETRTQAQQLDEQNRSLTMINQTLDAIEAERQARIAAENQARIDAESCPKS